MPVGPAEEDALLAEDLDARPAAPPPAASGASGGAPAHASHGQARRSVPVGEDAVVAVAPVDAEGVAADLASVARCASRRPASGHASTLAGPRDRQGDPVGRSIRSND